MNFAIGGDLKYSGELNAIKFVSNKLSKKDKFIIFDVGANLGDYGLACNKIF